MREGVRHGAGHGTGAMAGMADGLIGHNGLIRHNGQVCCTDNITHQQRKANKTPRAGRTRKWCDKNRFAKRAISHDEMCHFIARNGPFWKVKWAVLQHADLQVIKRSIKCK